MATVNPPRICKRCQAPAARGARLCVSCGSPLARHPRKALVFIAVIGFVAVAVIGMSIGKYAESAGHGAQQPSRTAEAGAS